MAYYSPDQVPYFRVSIIRRVWTVYLLISLVLIGLAALQERTQ